MTIVDRIRDDIKVAMRAKDQETLGTLRLLLSSIQEEGGAKRQRALDEAIQKAGVDLRLIPESELPVEEPLTEDEIEQVVRRELKKRQDAQDTYSKAKRPELAANEETAANTLRVYLPQQLDMDGCTSVGGGAYRGGRRWRKTWACRYEARDASGDGANAWQSRGSRPQSIGAGPLSS